MKIIEIKESQQNNLIARLKQDCGPYISILTRTDGKPLYRGSSRTNYTQLNGLDSISPRLDRLPRNIPDDVHNTLNELFTKKFGWPYRNGIFTTSDDIDASIYGKVRVLFPIGELKYVWHPGIGDLYKFYQQHKNILHRSLNEFYDVVNSYTNEHLASAIKLQHEVMLQNTCYVLSQEMYDQIKAGLL
jgi:hypothetical protein